ncbi:hypothetical protein VW35_18230 [Devosia soli]|uniref:Pyrroline-5-carboxylate reductase catalytic N-terminal domain-containing protein n=1 Tax=Devosia soli TaxID=361041 RepID=A0A0F5L3A4_9HYPH|nr:NAD(P)-binding domain-containing protein [Devosia soli]KKB76695.1 hypothetical protein VW35_18230 [Devosia soli]
MRIGILGSGQVGGTVAKKLAQLGHDVMIGSPHAKDKTAEFPGIKLGTAEEAASHGEWLVNAMHGEAAVEVLPSLNTAGKILIDIGNFEGSIEGPLERSLGETLQQALPQVRLVKTLNHVSAHLMVDPVHLGKTLTIFIASNDDEAKTAVTELLKAIGWQDIFDLGDLSACRAMEYVAASWVAIEKAVGGPNFSLVLVR